MAKDRLALIAYKPTPADFATAIAKIPPGYTVFMHQGVKGADMGEYVLDHSAVELDTLKDYQVFSGHYHKHHTVGTVTYVGTPYTVTAAEANDGPKGFLVLYEDGSFEQVPTGLRRHVTVERTVDTVLDHIPGLKPVDLLWLKVSGPYSELEKLDRQKIGQTHLGHANFKLDKLVTEAADAAPAPAQELPASDQFDGVIDSTLEAAAMKAYLKRLWRELI